MIEQIVNRLSLSIEDKTEKTIPLAKQLSNSDGKVFPAIYIGKGQYSEISIDNFAGLSYFRLAGKTQIQEVEQAGRPMNDLYRYQYTLRLVCTVQNSVIGKDDAFSSDALALLLVKNLNECNTKLKQDLSARSAIVTCVSYDTNVKDILSEEYQGIERLKNSLPYNYSLVAIDLSIDIIISSDCINNICKPYCYA